MVLSLGLGILESTAELQCSWEAKVLRDDVASQRRGRNSVPYELLDPRSQADITRERAFSFAQTKKRMIFSTQRLGRVLNESSGDRTERRQRQHAATSDIAAAGTPMVASMATRPFFSSSKLSAAALALNGAIPDIPRGSQCTISQRHERTRPGQRPSCTPPAFKGLARAKGTPWQTSPPFSQCATVD